LRFSVIIPAYQAARFIQRAVSSALDQTLAPHEVVVVDDGSTDDTTHALDPFRSQIVLYRQSNRGLGAARNTGIRQASGDWVVFLDSDDWWAPTRLAAIAEHVERNPHHRLITTDASVIDETTGAQWRYYERVAFAYHEQRTAILRSNFVFVSAAAPRTELIALGGFDEARHPCEDWDMWIRMIFAGIQVGLVTEPLAFYRIHDANMSHAAERMQRGIIRVMDKTLTSQSLSSSNVNEARLTRARARDTLRLLKLDDALRNGRATRLLGGQVALTGSYEPRTRLRGAFAAVAPGITRWRLRRRASSAAIIRNERRPDRHRR